LIGIDVKATGAHFISHCHAEHVQVRQLMRSDLVGQLWNWLDRINNILGILGLRNSKKAAIMSAHINHNHDFLQEKADKDKAEARRTFGAAHPSRRRKE
jgi:hypothetical protein